MQKKMTLKLADGFRVIHSDGVEVVEHFRDIFTDLFGWDIDGDDLAKQCYDAVFREVFCFGRCDLTQFTNNGKTLIIEVIPSTEGWKEVEE